MIQDKMIWKQLIWKDKCELSQLGTHLMLKQNNQI